MTVKKNEGGQVIVTKGEILKKPEGMPDELWVGPKSYDRLETTTAALVVALRVSDRRKRIIRKLVKQRSDAAKSPTSPQDTQKDQ